MKLAVMAGAAAIIGVGGLVGFRCTTGQCPLQAAISAIHGTDYAAHATTTLAAASGSASDEGCSVGPSRQTQVAEGCGTGPAMVNMAKATAAATFNVDPVHSSLHFMIKHAGVTNFYGRFNDLTGSFSIDPENPDSSTMTFTVKTDSIDTNNAGRNEHLKSPDFFNARQFPEVTFTSTSFAAAGEGMWEVTGNLTFHGVTKEVTANLNWLGTGSFRGADIAAFEATMEFKRSDFGMTTYIADDQGDGGPLGNTVTVLLSVEGGRQ